MTSEVARVESLDDLVALYPSPKPRTVAKKRPQLDEGFRSLLQLAPFVLLATSDAEGRCDVSPRGGPPGFVVVLDDQRVAIPDLNGNHLIDSLRNIVANPHAALLVTIPGQNETLRLDGRAYLTTDDDILDRFTAELRRPTLAVVIEIEHVFGHCAKAMRRAGLWDPSTWTVDGRPFLDARYRQLIADGALDPSVDSLDDYVDANDCGIEAGLALDAGDGAASAQASSASSS